MNEGPNGESVTQWGKRGMDRDEGLQDAPQSGHHYWS
jgi:hypothetical protein